MDMGLSCWSQPCSLPLKPRPEQWLGGCCLQSAAGKGQIKPRQWQEYFWHCCVSSSLRHPCWPHFASYFYSKGACRQEAEAEQCAQVPPHPCRQSRAQRTSHQLLSPRADTELLPGDNIKNRELDCTLPSSINELRCTTGGWLILTYSCSFPTHITQF